MLSTNCDDLMAVSATLTVVDPDSTYRLTLADGETVGMSVSIGDHVALSRTDGTLRLVATIQSVGASTIFASLQEAVNNARSSMRDIAEIISTDQGLSARLLRLVNSAFYGFPSKIETISHATTIVGTQQLRDLALATTIIELFKGIPSELINVRDFWHHSIACGITCRILASYHQEPNVERFFVGGLLHDIGRLLIYRRSAAQAREALQRCAESGELLHTVERETLGYDHAEAGGLLLGHWRLPKSLEEAVRFHHAPSLSRQYPLESGMTHVADLIANALQTGSSGEHLVPVLDSKAWEGLDLSISILPPVIQQMEQQFTNTVTLFLEGIHR